MSANPIQVLLAAPRGFCAGVDRAIEVVEETLERLGPPVYVRHAIVHNTHVVRRLTERGAVFVEDEDEVPAGEVMVLSAHGTAPQVRRRAGELGLRLIDATCPLVTKVHLEVARHDREERTILLIGHAGHQEVVGTTGHAPDRTILVETPADVWAAEVPDHDRVAWSTQTTLSVDETRDVVAAIRERFPNVVGPRGDDICYATQNRQDATKVIAARAELVLVVGSPHSSNSARMVEVALASGADAAYLIDSAGDIDPAWLDGVDVIGLTSGASAPEDYVGGVLDWLADQPRGTVVETVDVRDENVHFALPSELRSLPVARS